jgi:hypothetical protein
LLGFLIAFYRCLSLLDHATSEFADDASADVRHPIDEYHHISFGDMIKECRRIRGSSPNWWRHRPDKCCVSVR